VRFATAWLFAALAWAAALAHAQVPLTVGGVPYVPTPFPVVEAMLELAGTGPRDLVVDLGSGDGRIPITAAQRYGARAVGVELDRNLSAAARAAAASQGVAGRTQFVNADLFQYDFSKASVLTLYLLPEMNLRLRPRILGTLKPGARVVAHDFALGEWAPDRTVAIDVPGKAYGPPRSTLYLWTVPAQVAGVWRWRVPVDCACYQPEAVLTLTQTFQRIEGTATVNGVPVQVADAQLAGDTLRFTLVRDNGGAQSRAVYAGRVRAGRVSGTLANDGAGRPLKWEARHTVKAAVPSFTAVETRPTQGMDAR
jgi:SAM-dependent methyltransferase